MNQAYSKAFNRGINPVCYAKITANSLPDDRFKVRTCVAVKELPRGTDIEIEVMAIL
jgi:hypothetical protein